MWAEADRLRAPVGDFPPRWATQWGDDEYGLWAELVVGGVTQRLRWIEPGVFWMGSTRAERERIDHEHVRKWAVGHEREPQRVRVALGFWLADTPCTQAFWLAVVGGDNPSQFKGQPDTPERPVEQVTWHDTQRFLGTLDEQDGLSGLPTLPTEAQWEYACRAGTRTAYVWGDAPDSERANFNEQYKGTTPVRRFPANPWGLHDMHGNVWEWCADAWADLWQPEAARGASDDAPRAVRGGSWGAHPGGARSAYRRGGPPGPRWGRQGFRFALRSPSPGPGGPRGS